MKLESRMNYECVSEIIQKLDGKNEINLATTLQIIITQKKSLYLFEPNQL